MGQKEYSRAERVGDQIQRVLAQAITTEVADPNARLATVSGVEVSRDLRNAVVYVTPALGQDAARVVEALDHASGFLRKRLAKEVRFKYLPRLRFAYDPTLDEANHIEALLDGARRSDAEGC